MKIFVIFLLLSIISCSFATYYYTIGQYSSSTCSGTPEIASYISESSDGTCFQQGTTYIKLTCETQGLNVLICGDSQCTKNCSSETYPPCNSTASDGSYYGSYCGTTPPKIPSGLVELLSYASTNCTGNVVEKTVISQVCSANQKFACSGSTPTTITCSDSACNSNCVSMNLPTTCLSAEGSSGRYSCTSTGTALFASLSLLIIMLILF